MGSPAAGSAQAMYPLSPQQRRIWHQPSRTLDHIEFRIDREVSSNELASALGRLVTDHDILRMGFHHRAGVALPWQLVGPQYTPDIKPARDIHETQIADPTRFQGQPLTCSSFKSAVGAVTVRISLPA